MPIDGKDLARFESKFTRGPEGDCWLWTGAPGRNGYGTLHIGGRAGRRLYAHRLSYEQYVGPIPEGMTIDHVRKRGCTSRLCVNPHHLEVVTRRENSERAKPDYCPQRHPYAGPGADVYVNPTTGWRICRRCHREIHDPGRRGKK